MAYNEPYYDESYYEGYYEEGGRRNRLVTPVLSGCLGVIVGFACAACLAVGVFAFLLPVTSPASEVSAPQVLETPQVAAKPLFFNGSGKQTSPKFVLYPGVAIVRVTHDGGSSFIVALMDSNGNQMADSSGGAPIINEIGPYNGSIAVPIQVAGEYLLDVIADGNWTVSIEQ